MTYALVLHPQPFPFLLIWNTVTMSACSSHLVTTGKIYLLRVVGTDRRRKQSP